MLIANEVYSFTELCNIRQRIIQFMLAIHYAISHIEEMQMFCRFHQGSVLSLFSGFRNVSPPEAVWRGGETEALERLNKHLDRKVGGLDGCIAAKSFAELCSVLQFCISYWFANMVCQYYHWQRAYHTKNKEHTINLLVVSLHAQCQDGVKGAVKNGTGQILYCSILYCRTVGVRLLCSLISCVT